MKESYSTEADRSPGLLLSLTSCPPFPFQIPRMLTSVSRLPAMSRHPHRHCGHAACLCRLRTPLTRCRAGPVTGACPSADDALVALLLCAAPAAAAVPDSERFLPLHYAAGAPTRRQLCRARGRACTEDAYAAAWLVKKANCSDVRAGPVDWEGGGASTSAQHPTRRLIWCGPHPQPHAAS